LFRAGPIYAKIIFCLDALTQKGLEVKLHLKILDISLPPVDLKVGTGWKKIRHFNERNLDEIRQ